MAQAQNRRASAQACKRMKPQDTEPQVQWPQEARKSRNALSDVTNNGAGAELPSKGRLMRHATANEQEADPFALASSQPSHASLHGSQQRGFGQELQRVRDIDAEAAEDPFACATYAAEIFDNLFEAEKCQRPSTTYMERMQPELTPNMRTVLIDWMVEVAGEYNLVSETLFLAVSFLDRFLSVESMPRTMLQLAGITSILVAAKYEEIYAPTVEELCYITDNTYTRQDMLAMERRLLGALGFQCTVPTSRVFVRRFVQAAAADFGDVRLGPLSAYLMELALPDYAFLQQLPSQIAAAAVLLAQFALGGAGWSCTLEHYTSYAAWDLEAPASRLLAAWHHAQDAGTPVSAIHEKYCSPKYHCVAHIRAPHRLADWLFARGDAGVDVPIFAAGSPGMPLASASAMQLHGIPGFQSFQGLPGLSEGLIPAFHGR